MSFIWPQKREPQTRNSQPEQEKTLESEAPPSDCLLGAGVGGREHDRQPAGLHSLGGGERQVAEVPGGEPQSARLRH